jgi:hypothetical protein
MTITNSRLNFSRLTTTLAGLTLLASLGAPPGRAQTCTAPPAGLVAWWSGDGHFFDLAGTNHGAPSGGVSFAAGQVGPSVRLDGLSQFVRIPNSASLNPPGSFSIEVWLYPTRSANQILFAKWGDAGDYANQRSYTLLLTADNAVQFAISDAANQLNIAFHVFNTPANLIPLNAWTHVVAVYDQSTGTRRVYLNGVLKAERTDAPITVLNASAAAGLGAYLRQSTVPAAFFRGQMDEVSFYLRGLSANEVAALYAAGSAGKCKSCFPLPAGLVSWWPGENSGIDVAGTNHAVGVGGLGFAPGRVNQAFNLDGVSAFAQAPSPTGLPLGSQPRTVALWFRTPRNLTASTESALFQYGSDVNAQMFGLITSLNAPGKLYFFAYNRDLAGTTLLASEVWYHAAVTYDGATVTLYLNGQIEGSKSVVLNTVLSAAGLTLGHRPGGGKWQGQLDEVMLFNRALTPGEVAALHAAGSAGGCRIPSRPSLASARVGEALGLWWPSQVGFSYQLQSTTNLHAASWFDEGAPFAGTGGVLATNLPIGPEPENCFRLRLIGN